MQLMLFQSREFPKYLETTVKTQIDALLSGQHAAFNGTLPTKLWIDDSNTRLNHYTAFKAGQFGLDLTIIYIDFRRLRVTMPEDYQGKQNYKQYPHHKDTPKQADGKTWRSIFLSRDKWMIREALVSQVLPELTHLFFLINGKDNEVMEPYHYAHDLEVMRDGAIRTAGEFGLVHLLDMRSIYEASKPTQLSLF